MLILLACPDELAGEPRSAALRSCQGTGKESAVGEVLATESTANA